jgi:tetratricopeptide (TPR) repeat protein
MREADMGAERRGLVQTLAAGDRGVRLARCGFLAFALQLRPAWALLGPWLVRAGGSSSPWLPRVRFLPAHPDWYVPALVQSCATALTLAALARRRRPAWALLTAVVAGGLAWAVTFAAMPNGLDGFSQIFRPPQEMLGMAIVLVCLALTWQRPGPWGAVPVVALVGGVGAGAVPFLFSNTIFGSPWPEGWRGDLAVEVCGVALVAIALAVMRRMRFLEGGAPGGGGLGALLGTAGLLLLAVLHLAAGFRFSGWTMDDSRRLVVAAALLALLASAAAVARIRARRSARARISQLCLLVACLCAAPLFGQSTEDRLGSARGAERLRLLNDLSRQASTRSRAQAEALAREALELARSLKQRRSEADALRNLGTASHLAGDREQAVAYAEQALAIYREVNDEAAAGRTLNDLGISERGLSRLEQALSHSRQAETIAAKLQDAEGQAAALANVGAVQSDQGQYREGIASEEQALALARRSGARGVEALCGAHLGVAHYLKGDTPKALEYLLAASRIHRETGNKDGEASTSMNIGNVFLRTHQVEEAARAYERAMALAREVGDLPLVARLQINLGNVQIVSGKPDRALALFLESQTLSAQLRNRNGLAAAQDSAGLALQRLGRFRESVKYHQEALAIRREIGDKLGVVNSLNNAAGAYTGLRAFGQAQKCLSESLAIATEIKAKDKIRDGNERMAILLSERGDYRQALDYYEKYMDAAGEVYNEATNQLVTELNARYEADKRAADIALLEKEKKLLQQESQLQRLRILSLLGGFLAVLVILGLLFRRYLHLLAFWRRKHQIGRYFIGDRIGSGGLGVVYRARDPTQKSGAVAIKVIREEFCHDPVLTRRLKHEALLIDQLHHPNIVKVYERGEHDQQIYIVMELLQGRSLAEVLRRGPLEIPAVLSIGLQLAGTLAAIHAKGIVHRDLKPENVMIVDEDGRPLVKLLDFDIAVGLNLTRLTETGRIMGTLHYLPPEQITRQEVLAAGDVYSMGVLLYEALTGMKPFPAELPADIIRQILDLAPVPPARLRPGTPDPLSQLILDMLAKDPARRPAEDVVIERLRSVAGGP